MADEHQTPRERSSTSAIFDRISKIEGEFAESRAQMTGITVTLSGLQTAVARVQQMVESRHATDWKTLAAWASVILAAMAMFLQLLLTPIRSTQDSQTEALKQISEQRLTEARAQSQDVRLQIDQAERRGREAERIDQLRHQVDKLMQEHLDEGETPAPAGE